MPTSVFFLGAEVDNPSAGVIPGFVSRHSRNRHNRLDMHFGTESALAVLLSDAIGTVPAGASIEDVLRLLMQMVINAETILGSRFTLDAYADEVVFWRDLFARVVADGLDLSSSHSSFGPFLWQRYDTSTDMAVDVDGDVAEFTGSGDTQLAQFVGYPTFGEGELRFEVFVPLADDTGWDVSIQPWRDDVTDVVVFMRLTRIGGSWSLDAGFRTVDGDVITFATYSASEGWYGAKFLLAMPGGEVSVEIWPLGVPEPDFEFYETLPSTGVAHPWIALGESGKTSLSGDALSWVLNTVGSGNFADVCYGLAYGNPRWMAVGSMLGVMYSGDAELWNQKITGHTPSGTLPNFHTCATDGVGTWVVCKLSETTPWRAIGDPATSFWDRQTTSLAHAIWAIRFGGGLFVAVTQYAELATSSDGSTWNNQTTALDTSNDWLQDVCYGGGLWVAMGGGGAGYNEFKILVSSDGSTWDLYTISPALDDYYGNAIAYGNGLFVVVGYSGFVATSPNGVDWTLRDPGHTDDLNDVAYVDGLWVSVGPGGKLYETTDPTGAWTAQTSGFGSTAITTALGLTSVSSRAAPVFQVQNGVNQVDVSHRTLLVDNIKTLKTDTDPVRIYHVFALEAEIGHLRTLTLDAEVA